MELSRPAPGIRAMSRWIFNCYVVENSGEGAALVVDPGIPSLGAAAVAAVRELNTDPIRTVVAATHAHSDHVAGMPHIRRDTDAAIYLPAKVRDYLASETPRTPGPRAIARFTPILFEQPFDAGALVEAAKTAKLAGFGTGGPFRFDDPIEGFLDEGQPLSGAPEWQVLQTPGHTDCSTCFWHEASGTLLSGDTVLTYDGRAWFNPETTDETLMDATEARLRALPVQHLLPGHGRPISGGNIMGEALSHRERAPRGWFVSKCRGALRRFR